MQEADFVMEIYEWMVCKGMREAGLDGGEI